VGGKQEGRERSKRERLSISVAYTVRDACSQLVSKRLRLCGMNSKEREDALNEARCLSRIQHPYVTSYFESLYDKVLPGRVDSIVCTE
jgi:hypothetical protein